MGFNGYISAARMALAEERLRSTPDSIEQIAAECGFGNACYFTRVFKKAMACLPVRIASACAAPADEDNT